MIFARVFILCACVLGIEGARTQSKAIETALEKSTKEQEFGIEGAKTQTEAIETALEKSTKEQEAMSEMIAVATAGCKRNCNTYEMGNPHILDFDFAKMQKALLDKCGSRDCKDCPRCLAGAEISVDVEHNRTEKTIPDEALDDVAESAGVLPLCAAPATKMETECKLETTAGVWLKCAHYKTSWCNPEKAGMNPGDRFRFKDSPLCCKTDSEMNEKAMTNVEQRKEAIVREIETALDADRELEPLPVCTSGTTFRAEAQRDGTFVCRDRNTNELAENVCCDESSFELLSAKAAADDLCSTVKMKWCREGKRKKFESIDARFTCRKMYMCCRKGSCIGPVSNQARCRVAADPEASKKLLTAMQEQGMELSNLPAEAVCVAVPLISQA